MTAEEQQLTGDHTSIVAADFDLIDAWLAYCRDAEGAAASTLRAYRIGMNVFTVWLQESGNSGVVMPTTVIEFKGHLQAKYSAQTVNLRLSAVRGFYPAFARRGCQGREAAQLKAPQAGCSEQR